MRAGVHVSIAGGIYKAFDRAKALGCDTFQIFIKNPRGWKARDLNKDEIERVRKKKRELGLSPVIVHMTYLINLASPKDGLYLKSVRGLMEDYIRAGSIGAEYLVIHPGNHNGSGLKAGIERIQEGLNTILELDYPTTILLENVAGGGTSIGRNFQELKMIRDGVEKKEKLGLCFDTCHGFAAGYDLSNKEGWERVLAELERYFQIEDLKLLHVNDSLGTLGSHLDRHTHLGEGEIGDRGFEVMCSYSVFYKLPMILETPKNNDQDDLKNLRKLRSYPGSD